MLVNELKTTSNTSPTNSIVSGTLYWHIITELNDQPLSDMSTISKYRLPF